MSISPGQVDFQERVASLEQLVAQYEETMIEQTRKLQATLDDLARSNRELEQFAYVASHDLQAPLRTISSYLQLLEQRYKGQIDEKADKYITYAVEGAARMQSLINDLLMFSRLNRGGGRQTEVDLSAVVRDVLKNLETRLRDADASVQVGDLPHVTGDVSQLSSVMQNLLENAVKYRSEQSPCIAIQAARNGKDWDVLVQDNGIGIDPRYHERIFEVFQRLHAPGEYEGNGIGLSVVRKIVEAHGGRVSVRSQPGEGSTFVLRFPAIKERSQ